MDTDDELRMRIGLANEVKRLEAEATQLRTTNSGLSLYLWHVLRHAGGEVRINRDQFEGMTQGALSVEFEPSTGDYILAASQAEPKIVKPALKLITLDDYSKEQR